MEWFLLGIKILRLILMVVRGIGPYLREAFLDKDTLLNSIKQRPETWLLGLALVVVFVMLTVTSRHSGQTMRIVGKDQGIIAHMSEQYKASSDILMSRIKVLETDNERLKKAVPNCTPRVVRLPKRHHTKPFKHTTTDKGSDDRSLIYNLDKIRSQENHQREQP